MNFVAKFGAVADAVGEKAGELFHFSGCVGHFGFDQAAEISGEQAVTVELGRLVVASGRDVLSDLAEDPRIRRCGAADHHGIATSFCDHAHGILRSANVAVSDYWNTDSLLHVANYRPIR